MPIIMLSTLAREYFIHSCFPLGEKWRGVKMGIKENIEHNEAIVLVNNDLYNSLNRSL
jgi:hypothetical protein